MAHVAILLFSFIVMFDLNGADLSKDTVTIAILAKDKAHCLPLYLSCIEAQTWPANQTYIYIRTNNNNDDTAQLLFAWVERVKDRYLGICFDNSDVQEAVQEFKPHEWNSIRFKVLGEIRNQSLRWAYEHKSHYVVIDCDNFVLPHTVESLVRTQLPIVAPRLYSKSAYSNYHVNVDEYGYYRDSHFYLPLLNSELKGLVQVDVVHCTYFIRHDMLPKLGYDDGSGRHEYVIFSDIARKNNIPQYLDTRYEYGYLTFEDNSLGLLSESWFVDFCRTCADFDQKATIQ